MAAYCPKCGAKLYENALFCGSCGEKIPNVTMNTENQQVQPQYTQAVQQAQPEYFQKIQMTPPQNVYPSMTVQTDYDID